MPKEGEQKRGRENNREFGGRVSGMPLGMPTPWVLALLSFVAWGCGVATSANTAAGVGAGGPSTPAPAGGVALVRALTTPASASVVVVVGVGGAMSGPCGTIGASRPCASLQSALRAFQLWVAAQGAQGNSSLDSLAQSTDVEVRLGPGTFGSDSCNVTWPATRSLRITGSGVGPNGTTIDCRGEARVLRSSSPSIAVTGLALRGCASLSNGDEAGGALSGGCMLALWSNGGIRWVSLKQ